MDKMREVATKMWPQDAEILTEPDWLALASAIESGESIESRIREPAGEAKDGFLASLIIIYWTMKIVQIALEIKKEVGGLKGEEKMAAVLAKINARLTPDTPSQVVGSIRQIIEQLGF